MTKQILTSLIFLIIISSLKSQHSENIKISPEKRDKWIKETVAELMNFKPDDTIPPVTPEIVDLGDSKKMVYRVNKEALIKLNKGRWIFIIAHSSHDDEAIGDVSMAVDHKKNIYINEAHICGGLIHFESDQVIELKKTTDFFKYFISDTDSKGWNKFAY